MTNGEATGIVVPLNPQTRPEGQWEWRRLSVGDLQYREGARQHIQRVWSKHISDPELRVLWFIFDQTLGWKRREYLFTYREIRDGNPVTCGVGKAETNIRLAIRGLETKGFIKVTGSKRDGMTISLNLDWSEKTMSLPVPKKQRADQNRAAGADEFDRPDRMISAGQTERNRSPYIEQYVENNQLEQSSRLAPATDENSVFTPVAETNTQPAVRHRSRPAPRPQVDATGQIGMDLAAPGSAIVRTDPETAKRKAQAKTTAIRSRKDPHALEQTWKAAVLETFDRTVSCPAWTKREAAMVKNTIAEKWDGDAKSLHDFFDFVVRDWVRTVTREFKWMAKDPAPRTPTLGFVVSWWKRGFIPAWNVARLDKERDGLKDQERQRYHDLTKRQGMTHEQAMMALAEERTTSKLRNEMAREKAEAANLKRAGLIALNQANKRPVWGPDNPHPDSEIARRRRLEEAKASLPTDTPIPAEFDFGPLPDFESVHGGGMLKPGAKGEGE